MKCMSRNKVRFFYALYESKTPATDDYGNMTGEYDIQRGKPIEFFANISAAKGETQTRQYDTLLRSVPRHRRNRQHARGRTGRTHLAAHR